MMVWLFSLICELNNDFPYVWSISILNSINCSGQSKNVILIFNGIIQENLERVWARVPVTQTLFPSSNVGPTLVGFFHVKIIPAGF